MIVQIYEIQTPDEAEICIDAGVDHIGSVILAEDEWKRPDLKETLDLLKGTPVKTSMIPLFRDMDILSSLLDYYRPDFIHFCESLTDDQGNEMDLEKFIRMQSEIREKFPEVGIIRSIPIPPGQVSGFPALRIAKKLESLSDIFLTDTWLGKEPIEGFIGITGKRCDRRAARDLVKQSRIPVILAGGLSPENVYDALIDVRPAGADSCTWTNRTDLEGRPIRFQKDASKVRRFVKEVRRAEKEVFMDRKEQLKKEIERLRELLRDREAALPKHSVRPHQIQAIEDLEDEITAKEKELQQAPGDSEEGE